MQFLKKNNIVLILGIAVLIAISLHAYRLDLPCFNSDEASFAYNAYSILKTGADEYGKTMPTRFLAFGENKLPVIIYAIVPFLALFDVSEFTSRLPFIMLGIGAPILFYFLGCTLFERKRFGLIAAFIAAFSPWIQTITRHIHEAPVVMYFEAFILILFAQATKQLTLKKIIYISILNGLALFTYHSAKVLFIFNALLMATLIAKQKAGVFSKQHLQYVLIFLIPVVIFVATEIQTPNNRVSSLAFFQNKGFVLRIEQLRKEHPNRLIHNKATESFQRLSKQYASYFSPEFLVFQGDSNERFGFPGVQPINLLEYVMALIGLIGLFVHHQKHRWPILAILLIAPISAALTWQEHSLTRSFVMIVPLILLTAYGIMTTIESVSNRYMRKVISLAIGIIYLFMVGMSWDSYFFHYLEKPETASAWQCGYKEAVKEIESDIKSGKTIYFTRKLGQPYIFTLFYQQYPPDQYQRQANLSELDEYGFGQVEKYDNFRFTFQKPVEQKETVYVGYPEEFEGVNLDQQRVTKISTNGKEIFWIYR